MLLRLFEIARRFDMEIQPQLILLQKTLLNIEGLGRELYPDLDLWTTAKPFLEDWMASACPARRSPRSSAKGCPSSPPSCPSCRDSPSAHWSSLPKGACGCLDDRSFARLERSLRESTRRRQRTLVGCALMIAGALLLGLDGLPRGADWAVVLAGVLLAVSSFRH